MKTWILFLIINAHQSIKVEAAANQVECFSIASYLNQQYGFESESEYRFDCLDSIEM